MIGGDSEYMGINEANKGVVAPGTSTREGEKSQEEDKVYPEQCGERQLLESRPG
jgi:hypothetical protein